MSKFLYTLLIIALLCCESGTTDRCGNAQTGVLKNLTGLDGCAWIIQLPDSTKLEPVNIDTFDIDLIENRQVCFRYHERPDLGSICMVGKVVELDFIE